MFELAAFRKANPAGRTDLNLQCFQESPRADDGHGPGCHLASPSNIKIDSITLTQASEEKTNTRSQSSQPFNTCVRGRSLLPPLWKDRPQAFVRRNWFAHHCRGHLWTHNRR